MNGQSLALLFILLFLESLKASGQAQTFSVKAEEVRIDVLVTEKGKPLPSLSAEDFEVSDNGVVQQVRYAALQKQTPVSVTLVFDMSRSVAGPLLRNLREAAHTFLDDLKKDDQVALVTFNNAITLNSPPTRDIEAVNLALDRAEPYGNSSLIDGSYTGLLLAGSSPNPPLLIIFSDGRDTFSWLSAETVLETARRNGAVAYAISTSRLPEASFLRELSKITGGSVFEVESTKDLSNVFVGILNEFRHRYLVTYIPDGVAEGGWHKLDVKVKKRSAKISARPGYMRATQ